ncbi:TlpA family protein disulfide reductase [Candidatus Sumerlaeota bacterium]|nr:TlpA family protein disulfide reductase [Candidatus Sumerlaeota bacterium]
MRFFSFCFLVALFFLSPAISTADGQAKLHAADSATTTTVVPTAPPISILENTKAIQNVIANHGSDLLVVNFWATFCGPCVEEMPYFVELSRKFPEKRVRVVGFSADLKSQLESHVKPFLAEKKIPYANYLIYTDDQGAVINLFHKEWDGALPATFFYDKSGKQIGYFLEPVTASELNQKVVELLKQVDAGK